MLDLADLCKINDILFHSEVRCSRNLYHIEATALICFLYDMSFTKRYFQKDDMEVFYVEIFGKSKDVANIDIYIFIRARN